MTRRPQRHIILAGDMAEQVRAYARYRTTKGHGDEIMRINVRTTAELGEKVTIMPWGTSVILQREPRPPHNKYVALSARSWLDMFKGAGYL